MTELAWIIGGFLIASVPYSLLIGFIVFRLDIRQFGDGNPGATNVYRATGSKFWYIVAVCLDGFKGLFPVGIAHWIVGLDGWTVAAIGVAGVAGHAFSPFLRFNGGKAVAITGGIWTGLTIMEAPIVMAVLLIYWYKSVAESNWAVVLWLLSFLVYLLLTQRHPAQLAMWLGNFLIVAYRHRDGLNQPPTWQPWLPFMRQA